MMLPPDQLIIQQCTGINRTNYWPALDRLPALSYHVTASATRAAVDYKIVKITLAAHKARVGECVAQASTVKRTERQIRDAVTADPEHRRLEEIVAHAWGVLQDWRGLLEALKAQKEILIQISAHDREDKKLAQH